MKKRIYFILLLMFFLGMNLTAIDSAITGETITGETVTGEATQAVGISVFVTAYLPLLNIITPTTNIYLTNESIFLNYTVKNQETVWYNIDNSANITITSSIYFNTSQGTHTLYLYANSSFGNITATNTIFTVNSTKFIIIDDEYETGQDNGEDQGQMNRNQKKGESTDFLNYSYEALQELENIVLDQPNFGKIQFNEAINLTDDLDTTDNTLDLNSNTEISSNLIEIDTVALPNFNKPATLSLYNLTFSNPRILKDSVVCPSNVCVEESYSGGTLVFTVTSFSTYSTEETPAGGSTSSSSSGGGGGGAAVSNFSIDKDLIKVLVTQGESKRETILLKNTQNTALTLNINSSLKEFMAISEESFSLKPGEEKLINLDIFAKERETPDSYIGRIIIKDLNKKIVRVINVIIEIREKEPLFDLNVDLYSRELEPWDYARAKIGALNVGDLKNIDILLYYSIQDFQGNTLAFKEESIAIKNKLDLSKKLRIPRNAPFGAYVFYTKISYGDITATGTDSFMVVQKEDEWPNLILLGATLILIGILILLIRRNKKRKEL